MILVSTQDFDVRQLVSIILAERLGWGRLSALASGEHLRRRTKRQSEKEHASQNNEEKTIRERGTRTYRGTCDEEGETLRRFLSRSNTGTKQKKTETGPPVVLAHTQRTRCTSARNEKRLSCARILWPVYRIRDKNDKDVCEPWRALFIRDWRTLLKTTTGHSWRYTRFKTCSNINVFMSFLDVKRLTFYHMPFLLFIDSRYQRLLEVYKRLNCYPLLWIKRYCDYNKINSMLV